MSSPLSFSRVSAEGATPARWLLFLHGILGSGANWRSFARRVVEAYPDWGGVLVDLRKHGQSQEPPPPHTVQAAAEDLGTLELPGPVRGVLGHSFGGKVALLYAAAHAGSLDNLFVLDASPGPRPTGRGSETSLAALALLEAAPPSFETLDTFVTYVQQQGLSQSVALWLAMNLRLKEGRYRFGLELSDIRQLMESYFRCDAWPALERAARQMRTEVVVGGQSQVFDEPSLERVRALAETGSRLAVHVLPKAGHWVHVDDPDGVFQAIRAGLEATRARSR